MNSMYFTNRKTLTKVAIFVIVATIANAFADAIMQKMIIDGVQFTNIIRILDWTPLQWAWHICKWIYFNGCIGALSIMLIGWINTLFIGFGCFIIWEVSYTISGCIWLQ